MLQDPPDESTVMVLRVLGERYPNADAVLAQIARLSATLTLPKATVHVVSDVHGEFKKLNHILRNASGSLRPLVERTFGDRLSESDRMQLLSMIYYPGETFAHLAPTLADQEGRRIFLRRIVSQTLELLRALAQKRPTQSVDAILREPFRDLLRELIHAPQTGRSEEFIHELLEPFLDEGKDLDLLRVVARAVRNLSVSELIVAGDLGDRGPRIDKVIDTLMRQPKVAMAWGNHDVSWIGACLGHEALIATVLRISLRYRRLSQLEEGYGIPAAPVEKLARTVYSDDPAERFPCKGEGLRDALWMARMQKAMAILQFKLEGQVIRRNPAFLLDSRTLLHRIDRDRAAVEIEGTSYPMLDARLPTIDPADPYALSPEEHACIARLKRSFLESRSLWEHVQFIVKRGAMALIRDDTLIFHGCVPVAADGSFLAMRLGGGEFRGKALFDELGASVRRALHSPSQEDLDRLWYLWTGPLSPLFGKDKMATFESYFVADKATHAEKKNPYFTWIRNADFCARICGEFGVDPARGLIVNGHVPVRVEKGESPLKEGGGAVTIDGAFSEAYGDRGYTLVLDPQRTYLAEHHHFESVSDAITRGADIIPTIQDIRVFDAPRTIGDTEDGRAIRREIEVLRRLLHAYRHNLIPEQS